MGPGILEGQHNVKVIVEVRPEFKVLGCDRKPDWGCTVTPPGNRPASLVTWTRESPGVRDNENDRLHLRRPHPPGGPLPV